MEGLHDCSTRQLRLSIPSCCLLTDYPTPYKHEPGLEGRARAGRGRGFSEGGGIGDPGSLSASIYVAVSRVDSWSRVIGLWGIGFWVMECLTRFWSSRADDTEKFPMTLTPHHPRRLSCPVTVRTMARTLAALPAALMIGFTASSVMNSVVLRTRLTVPVNSVRSGMI